uniref:leucine-rich repeat domain-containing protein n=1 Tax=Salinibacter altiplanensis TaxID=1803181 RepID=UPI0018F8B00B
MSYVISQIEEITGEELKEVESIDSLSTDPESVENGYAMDSQGNVTELKLDGMPLGDLTVLREYPDLEYLILLDCGISDIEPLRELVNLTELHLGGNEITDIGPLQNLNNLTGLYLGHNEIADIGPLQNLTDLKELYLQG